MAQIKTKEEFEAIVARVEELLPKTWGDDVPEDSPENIELRLLTEMVCEYEDEHVKIEMPTLPDLIKLRLYERNLTQRSAADLLGITPPHMSAIISGKSEPSLPLARNISRKLDIPAEVVLGA